MSKACVGQSPSAVQSAKRTRVGEGQHTSNIGITVKSRELWESGQFVHLHRFISPRNVTKLTGGPDAPHTRTHTSVPAARKNDWRNLA